MKKAVIIGAGLSGLTAAYYLKKEGWEVAVLEKGEKAGGLIQTFHEGVFMFECGPSSGILNHETIALFNSLKGELVLELAKSQARRRLVWKNGQWHIFPVSFKTVLNSPLFTFRDKLQLLLAPFKRNSIDMDVTVEESLKYRYGQSFWEYAVVPYIIGTYAGDPKQLIARYVYPDQNELKHVYGNLITGNFLSYPQKKKLFKTPNIYVDFTVRGGFSNLANVLAAKLTGRELLLNVQNMNVFPSPNGYSVHYDSGGKHFAEMADAVVSTVGAYAVPSLLPFLRDDELNIISGLEYASIVQAVVGYNKWRGLPLKAYGGYLPVSAKSKILKILSPSLYFDNLVPDKGAVVFYVSLGGTLHPDVFAMSDEQIHAIVLNGMHRMMLTPDKEPDLFRIFRHENSIPQYNTSTPKRIEIINNIQNQFPGLIIAGDLRDGFRVSDRIKQGTQIAQKLIVANNC